jgi:hypothetical protein
MPSTLKAPHSIVPESESGRADTVVAEPVTNSLRRTILLLRSRLEKRGIPLPTDLHDRLGLVNGSASPIDIVLALRRLEKTTREQVIHQIRELAHFTLRPQPNGDIAGLEETRPYLGKGQSEIVSSSLPS